MLAYKWGRRCWRTSGGEDAGVLVRQHMLAYKWGRRCWRTRGGEDAGVQVGEKMLAYKWGRRCWRTSGGEDAGVQVGEKRERERERERERVKIKERQEMGKIMECINLSAHSLTVKNDTHNGPMRRFIHESISTRMKRGEY